jgi:CHASE3 domain sensor protein
MSGETEKAPSGWTVDTALAFTQRQIDDLRALLDERKQAQEVGVNAALLAAEKAVAKAETAAEKRFESVNEFRAQLSDQASTFLSRVEAQAEQRRVVEKIEELTDRMNRSEGKGIGASATVVYFLAGISALGTLVALWLALK